MAGDWFHFSFFCLWDGEYLDGLKNNTNPNWNHFEMIADSYLHHRFINYLPMNQSLKLLQIYFPLIIESIRALIAVAALLSSCTCSHQRSWIHWMFDIFTRLLRNDELIPNISIYTFSALSVYMWARLYINTHVWPGALLLTFSLWCCLSLNNAPVRSKE